MTIVLATLTLCLSANGFAKTESCATVSHPGMGNFQSAKAVVSIESKSTKVIVICYFDKSNDTVGVQAEDVTYLINVGANWQQSSQTNKTGYTMYNCKTGGNGSNCQFNSDFSA